MTRAHYHELRNYIAMNEFHNSVLVRSICIQRPICGSHVLYLLIFMNANKSHSK